MEASSDFSDRCWYKPDGQTQRVRMDMKGAAPDYTRSNPPPKPALVIPRTNRKSSSNTRAHYRPSQNTMASHPNAPHYQRARQLPRDFLPSEDSTTSTSSAERYLIPQHKFKHPHAINKQLSKPVPPVYVRVNELDTSRSWYLPKQPKPHKNAKEAGNILTMEDARKSRAGKDGGRRFAHDPAGSSGLDQDAQRPRGLVKGWYGTFRKAFDGF